MAWLLQEKELNLRNHMKGAEQEVERSEATENEMLRKSTKILSQSGR